MKRIISIVLTVVIALSAFGVSAVNAAAYSSGDFKAAANDIVNWRKHSTSADKCLFTEEYVKKIAANAGDEWYALYMGRLGFEDYPKNFLDAISAYVKSKYSQLGDAVKGYKSPYPCVYTLSAERRDSSSVIHSVGNQINAAHIIRIAACRLNRKSYFVIIGRAVP